MRLILPCVHPLNPRKIEKLMEQQKTRKKQQKTVGFSIKQRVTRLSPPFSTRNKKTRSTSKVYFALKT
jgi:hypothetical protein